MNKDDKDQTLDHVVIKETHDHLPKTDNQKTKMKLLKKQEKELKKIAKAKAKVDKALTKNSKPKRTISFFKKKRVKTDSEIAKKDARKNLLNRKDLKVHKEKEPRNYKLGAKEFPVKMVKEVSKVR
jgi:hypothetical protein